MHKIWMKLAAVMLAVSLGGIVLSTVFSIKEMNDNFSYYLHDISREHNQEIVRLLAANYEQYRVWDEHSFVMLEDIATVLDLHILLYDDKQTQLGDFQDGAKKMEHPFDPADLLPIRSVTSAVGYVAIFHNDLTETQALAKHFRSAHTSALVWTMLFVSLVVGVIGILLARLIVKPVERMRSASLLAAEGDLSVRVPLPAGEDELTELVRSFNQLVATLERQEQLRKQFTSDIAHELRTPLNTVLAQVEGMIDGVWKATPEHLESTRSEVLRLSQLVRDLDQVIQHELGTERMTFAPTDLSELVQEVCDSMSALFAKSDISLILQSEPSIRVLGDRHKIAQVVINLLANSRKHTKSGGTVTVTLGKHPGHIQLTVADTGTGIAKDDLPFVFERFFRGDRSRQRETGSSGLGLTIAKGIVEAHRGTISIQSEAGHGTVVSVSFPEP
ncbi:MAG: sensor histidine kinase [Clostridia bacterium]